MNRKERRAVSKSAVPQPTPTAPPLARDLFTEAVQRHQAGQEAEAAVLYQAILILNPRHVEASYNLGVICQTIGRFQEAILAYRNAVALRPDFVDALANLGTVLKDTGQFDEATEIYRHVIAQKPDFPMAYLNFGVVLKDQGRIEDAMAAYRQAIALKPDYDQAYANLGAALLEDGRLEEAEQACRQAVSINPRLTMGFCNLGAIFKAQNRLAEAEIAYRQAVALGPDFPEAHFCLAQIFLLQGNLEPGWVEYDWRWRLKDYGWLKNLHGEFAQPAWNGEPLAGKTILVYAEQGLGDTLQFARYLPLLVRLGAKVVLAVQPPLIALLQGLDGVTVVALDRPPLPHFDVHCALLSLPRVFGTTLATIPGGIPYLRPDPALVRRWDARIGGSKLRVGIVWAGNPNQKGDALRSPRLAAMSPLFATPNVDFVSLQLGAGRQDIAATPLPPNVLDLGDEIADFADTAAIMAGLDLVITSCTAPLHLAGALGVPTWAVIPFAPHFFWLLDRADSPWYPTLRLYRQDRPGHDWSRTIGRVGADLAALADAKRSGLPASARPMLAVAG